MGRSQESFGKQGREKTRQKKKEEKQQRKEERKANSDKTKSFDDMIAYVDEYGNITSTPPDPTRKKTEVNLEDIQIGISRQAPVEPGSSIRNGTVTFFNESKGYGFIKDTDTQESIFVHVNGLSGPISENDKVTFETEMGHKGLNAVRVQLKK